MSNGRAAKGGETGLNGERYAGGTFLPSTTLPKGTPKSRPARSTARRQQVARYEWADSPSATARAIFPLIVGTRAQERNGVMSRYEPFIATAGEQVTAEYTVDALIAMWMAGERWIEV